MRLSNGEIAELTMAGNVIRGAPPLLDFGGIRDDQVITRELVVRPHRPRSVLKEIDYDPSVVSLEYEPGPLDKPTSIQVSLRPGMKRGAHVRSRIRVTIADKDGTRSWSTDVRATVLDTVDAAPARLVFGVVGSESKLLTLTLTPGYASGLDLVSIESSHPDALVALQDQVELREGVVAIPIELRGSAIQGGFSGVLRLTLKTSDGETVEVKVPAYALTKRT
jgi:hypothetical protein